MPTRKFAFTKGGPKRLHVSKPLFGQQRTVRLDGRELGVIPNRRALRRGWKHTFKNGRTLSIRRVYTLGTSQLEVLLDGRPLPGSDTHPQTRLNTVVYLTFFIAALNIISVLLISASIHRPRPEEVFLAELIMGIGVVYMILAFFIYRRSFIALLIVVGIYVLDLLLLVLTLNIVGVVFRAYVLAWLSLGFIALRDLKAPSRRDTSDSEQPVSDSPASPPRNRLVRAVDDALRAQQPAYPSEREQEERRSRRARISVVVILASLLVGLTLAVVIRQQRELTGAIIQPTSALPDYPTEPILTDTTLVKVIYDPATNRAYGLSDGNYRVLYFDLTQKTVIAAAQLDREPSDACLDAAGERLYVVYWGSTYIAVVDLDQRKVIEEILWPGYAREDTRNWYPESHYFRIICQPDRLFLVDAADVRQLWSVHLTEPGHPVSAYNPDPVEVHGIWTYELGIGDLTFTSDPQEFYAWQGNREDTQTELYRLRIEHNMLRLAIEDRTGRYGIVPVTGDNRLPEIRSLAGRLDTPIFLDEAGGRVIVSNYSLNANNLLEVYHTFELSIRAVHWEREQAVGIDGIRSADILIYDLTTYQPITPVSLPRMRTPLTQMFYATDGTLYILYGEAGVLYYIAPL